MRGYDMDLLRSLKVLVEEQSVVGAARRLQMSEATMSRNLTRLREIFADPILVRSGRGMVASFMALALRDRVQALVSDADGLLEGPDIAVMGEMSRSFTIRANDLIVASAADLLMEVFNREAPRCTLIFAPETDDMVEDALRGEQVDIYLGATDSLPPEIRRQTLGRVQMRCVVRVDHPIFEEGISAEALTRYDHISVSRRGRARGPIDTALRQQGLSRRVTLVVPTYHAMVGTMRATDMLLALPDMVVRRLPLEALGLGVFDFPFPLPVIVGFQAWHPRWDNDPSHKWLRRNIFRLRREIYGES
ncbi:MAG TPA: LysR family transcriptional regulator [Novosphingobium sp.]|nr:LysR family transcriptional regulator [Novosphingobium sp.]